MKLSIVTTTFNSRATILEFLHLARLAAKTAADSFEIIAVDDGSRDDSVAILLQARQTCPELRVIELSRNFGHHRAIFAGLAEATGDLIYLVDSDLEERPDNLPKFLEVFKGNYEDCDVVYGVQDRSGEPFARRLLGVLFFKIFNCFSKFKIPENGVISRVMTRRYVDALLTFSERHLVLAGVAVFAGFKQKSLPIRRIYKGNTQYSILRRISLAIESVVSFSRKPLDMVFFAGIFALFTSLVAAIFLVVRYLLEGSTATGWTSLAVLFIGGFGALLTGIGVCAIYIGYIYDEVKGRPRHIIRRVH